MKQPKTIKADVLTREMIRSIKPGESVIFVLPSFSSVLSARTTIYQVRKLDNAKLTANATENIITVTRHE